MLTRLWSLLNEHTKILSFSAVSRISENQLRLFSRRAHLPAPCLRDGCAMRCDCRMALELARPIAERFLHFVNKTGSPYHSVQAVIDILTNAGFEELNER